MKVGLIFNNNEKRFFELFWNFFSFGFSYLRVDVNVVNSSF